MVEYKFLATICLMTNTPLSLSTYLSAIKLSIDEIFCEEVWVVAEIRSINSKGGHYYFELAEKDSYGSISASCKATLWKNKAALVTAFTQATGHPLVAGLKVLLKGKASFHTNYGFSFNISQIDPSYTLGELAQAYQAMRQKLHELGLDTLNKRLPTPFDIRHVLVIAPEKAAGLGDFRAEADRLAQAGACEFHYTYATFQGNDAPKSLRSAITQAFDEFSGSVGGLPDLLVIIRGGGAVGDLAYLNDYELAAMVAESPVPVWVGIGHERDTVILDEVAHTRFDTPSKVITAIMTHLLQLWQSAKNYQAIIKRQADTLLETQQQKTTHQMMRIHQASLYQLTQSRTQTSAMINTVKSHSVRLLTHTRQEIKHYQSLILTQHPKRTLDKGYALIRHAQSGALINSVTQVHACDTLALTLKDGTLSVVVQEL